MLVVLEQALLPGTSGNHLCCRPGGPKGVLAAELGCTLAPPPTALRAQVHHGGVGNGMLSGQALHGAFSWHSCPAQAILKTGLSGRRVKLLCSGVQQPEFILWLRQRVNEAFGARCTSSLCLSFLITEMELRAELGEGRIQRYVKC